MRWTTPLSTWTSSYLIDPLPSFEGRVGKGKRADVPPPSVGARGGVTGRKPVKRATRGRRPLNAGGEPGGDRRKRSAAQGAPKRRRRSGVVRKARPARERGDPYQWGDGTLPLDGRHNATSERGGARFGGKRGARTRREGGDGSGPRRTRGENEGLSTGTDIRPLLPGQIERRGWPRGGPRRTRVRSLERGSKATRGEDARAAQRSAPGRPSKSRVLVRWGGSDRGPLPGRGDNGGRDSSAAGLRARAGRRLRRRGRPVSGPRLRGGSARRRPGSRTRGRQFPPGARDATRDREGTRRGRIFIGIGIEVEQEVERWERRRGVVRRVRGGRRTSRALVVRRPRPDRPPRRVTLRASRGRRRPGVVSGGRPLLPASGL